MKTSQTLLLTSVLSVLASCAPQTFRADVGAMVAAPRGEIGLQNAGGSLVLHDEMNDLDTNLGLGDKEVSPYVRLQWDHERHRVRIHGFGFESSGSGVLAGDFGGIAAGSAVSTSMTFFNTSTGYSYALLEDQNFRLGLGGQLAFNVLNVAARSGAGREEVETDVLVPEPFIDGEIYLGERVTIGANAGLMAVGLRDGDGRYWDVDAWGRVRLSDEIELVAGYRYLLMDVHGTASSRDYDADIEVQGWWIGGGIRF